MKANQLKSGILLSYLSRIIQIVVGILYTPIMIRLLGQSEYGLYNIAASVISYLGVLNLGFGSAYMRFYTRYRETEGQEKVANLNGMFLEIFILLGILAVLSGVVIAFNVELIFGNGLSISEIEIARVLVLILVVNLAVSFPTVVFTTYLQANEQFIAQNLLLIANQIATPLVTLPLLLMGLGSVGQVLGFSLVSITTNLLTIFYAKKKLDMHISFNQFDWILFREMSSFSFFIFINMVVDQINNNADKIILGRFQGSVAVAIYSVGANLNTYYTQLSSSIANVFIPRVHRMEAKMVSKEVVSNLFIRVGRLQFILLSFVCSGFLVFGKPFIYIWAGPGYGDSYLVAAILMISITIPLIQNLGIEIQRAKNKHQFRSWLYIFMAIGNLILSIPLSIFYGAIGATIGTALSYVIGNGFVMNWYNAKKIDLDIKKFWIEIARFLPAFIIPGIYGFFINYYVDLYKPFKLIIFGIMYILIFSISMWKFGLSDYEKGLIRNPFK